MFCLDVACLSVLVCVCECGCGCCPYPTKIDKRLYHLMPSAFSDCLLVLTNANSPFLSCPFGCMLAGSPADATHAADGGREQLKTEVKTGVMIS